MSKWLSATLISAAPLAVFATLAIDSVWLDEAFSAWIASEHSVDELWTGLDPHHPALYYVILHAFVNAFGTGEAALRLPSAIAFLINIGLVALLTHRLRLGVPVALLAAVLISLSPLHIWYAQEARMYALVMTATLLFAFGLVSNSWTGAMVATVSLTTSLFLDFTAVPLVVAILAMWTVWWWHTGHHAGPGLRAGAVVSVAAFLAQPVWRQLSTLLPNLDRVTLFRTLAGLMGLERIPATAFLIVLVFAALVVVAGSALLVRLARTSKFMVFAPRWVAVVFLALTLITVIPRGYSAKPIVAVAWPLVTILAAWCLVRSRSKLIYWSLVVCVIAAGATIATPRADWRSAVRHVDEHHIPGDVVWLDPGYNSLPYNYYQPRITPTTNEATLSRAAQLAPGTGLWLVAERFGKAPPTSTSEEWLDAHLTLQSTVNVARLELRRYVHKVTP